MSEPVPVLSPIDVIPRRHWIRLAIKYLLLGTVALWYSPRADPFTWRVHGLWCLAGLAMALPTLLRALRSGFQLMLTDHRIVFLAAFSLYYLVGASLPAFGPDIQIQASLNLYPTGPGSALRVDGVNSLGFGLALLASALARGRWLGAQAGKIAAYAGQWRPQWVAGTFLVLGAAATAYRIPYDFGFQQGVVSGLVRMAGQLSLAAIFMAVSSRGAHERTLRWLGVALAGVLVSVGALQFMKSEVLLPMVALTAGLALRFGSLRVLPWGAALIVTAFLTLGELVNYGRIATGTSYIPSSLAERWSYLQEGWIYSTVFNQGQQYGYWGRLCYVPTQVASLDFQDEGRGGDGLRLMWWTFVPRVLAPNKPQMTAMFAELNQKITGSDLSSNSPGIFVSGYYHGGWWGVWLASLLCGWILAQTSAIAHAVYLHQAAVMVPFSLLGMFIAFRIDGDFIPDYLGVFMYILYSLLIAAVFVPKRSTHGVPSGQPEQTPC